MKRNIKNNDKNNKMTKTNEPYQQSTLVEPWFFWVWFNHGSFMFCYHGLTISSTMVNHMVEPYQKNGSTIVEPWLNHGIFW